MFELGVTAGWSVLVYDMPEDLGVAHDDRSTSGLSRVPNTLVLVSWRPPLNALAAGTGARPRPARAAVVSGS